MANNTETIEWIKEETARGESSLDTAGRVYGALKETDPELVKEFNESYESYADGEQDEMPEELLERIYEALRKAPEYVPYDRNSDIDTLLGKLNT